MTVNIAAIFQDEKYNDEYLKFEKVETKFTTRPDLHAFILLDKLIPGSKTDIISAAEHDEIYISTNLDKLAEVITEEQCVDLIRCGVRYSEDHGCFTMFT